MLLSCAAREDSWESLGLQGDPTSPSLRKSTLNIHWEDWCWSWSSNSLGTWSEESTHWKRPWCWERLKAGREGGNRGWDGWMTSPTPGSYSNTCPSHWWCHSTISFSVIPFSSCLQSFSASGSFQISQFSTSGGQVLEFQLQNQSFQWIFRTDFL